MPRQRVFTSSAAARAIAAIALLSAGVYSATGDEPEAKSKQGARAETGPGSEYHAQARPILEAHCFRCHNAETMESGVRIDQFDGPIEEQHLPLLLRIRDQLADRVMPPEEEPQPTDDERRRLSDWITKTVKEVRSRDTARNGSVRRLTVSQYRNTLRDLLGSKEDFTDRLPPDGISKDGFANNGQALVLSPLQVETCFEIAEQALDACIVDEQRPPAIQNFRMDLGAAINPQPCPDNLILGANNDLLPNADFIVTQLKPEKPFAYEPYLMRTKHRFIEGYAGNDTVRGWREFDSVYHSVFACMRGTPGYPKGAAREAVPEGLLLRPALPSEEIFGQSDTYGPMANFKISLRELPDHGEFRVTVKAARYDDGLLLESGAPASGSDAASRVEVSLAGDGDGVAAVAEAGIYQVDAVCGLGAATKVTLKLGNRQFSSQVPELKSEDAPERTWGFVVVRLPAGSLPVAVRSVEAGRVRKIMLSRIDESSDLGRRFAAFEKRSPTLGVHVGLRRDCGSTLAPVGEPQVVSQNEFRDFVFEGAINDFPSPDVEKDNVNYLAGLREIGVRHEPTDGRDMPRLVIKSVEFEGPYYDSWPPATHRAIFIESPHAKDSPDYARAIIRAFATRAFRRPVTADEGSDLFAIWQRSIAEGRGFQQSIKDALLAVLTAPQFLFLIEESRGPEAESLDPYELASKLSYFLWNAPPDQQLLELAAANSLHDSLDAEIDRMIHDPRFRRCVTEFASQWLSLDKFDVVATDLKRFPDLTRETRRQLRQEPVELVRYLIQENLSVRNLIDSDFIMANDVVAEFYGLGDRVENGLTFIPLQHNKALGGVLTQASILAGLSDGRESHPIKRGAWLARKIIAEPPDDPPPNVPKLPEDDGSHLTLRQKLERHRNQKGCVRCHTGIDPWGLPFEMMSAGGLAKTDETSDTSSILPDGTNVADLNALKSYLAHDRIDQVAFSFAKHVAIYACGRSLTYNELEWLRENLPKLRSADYRAADIIRFIVTSDIFLKK